MTEAPDRFGTGSPTWRVLRKRRFGLFFSGNFISATGTWLQNIAQTVLIFRLTGSTFFVALVNAAQFLGPVILAPWAGSAADRYDRRRILFVAQGSSAMIAAILAVLSLLGQVTVPILVGCALGIGLGHALSVPATQALLPSLVDEEDIAVGIALNASTFNLARAVGPFAGAFVVAGLGFTWAFTLNSVSFLAVVVALFAVKPRPQHFARSGRARLSDSLRVVRSDSTLVFMLVVVAVVSMAADPVNTLTPVFSTEVFARPDSFTGILVSGFGLGAVIGVSFVAHRFTASIRIVALALGLLGAGIACFGLSSTAEVGFVSLVVAGVGYLTAVTLATTMIHASIVEEHRGRVMAIWSMSFFGIRPLASLIDGSIESLAGPRTAALCMAVPALLLAGWALRRAAVLKL